MVKKSRRQREGPEKVYPYNVVDQDVSGQNKDSVETSVACDESSSTVFQPEASNKSHAVLRLQKKTSKYKSSKLGGGSEDSSPQPCPPAMHAVANGERTEAFKNGERETVNGSDGVSPLVETGADSTKRAACDRPCPKSKKSRGVDPEPALDVAGPTEAGGEGEEEKEDVRVEKEEANVSGEVQQEEQHVNGATDECKVGDSSTEPSVNGIEESEHRIEGSEHGIEVSDHEIEGSEHGIEGSENGIEGSEQEIEGSELGIEGSELGIEGSEHGIEVSEQEIEGSELGIEGIVTEPEDHADQESCNLSDPDVTISYLEGEGEEGSEPERGRESTEPLIEFPTDSPGKTSTPHVNEVVGSDVDDGIDSDFVAGDNAADSDDPMGDAPNTSMDRGYKVLHHLLNPTRHGTTAKTAESKSERTEWGPDASFGRSLRSLSGRRTMKWREGEGESSPTEAGSPSFFGFGLGKRKSEAAEDEGGEHETKRAKPDAGVDSLGYLARLTSPVIDRLRAITVSLPFRSPAQEVTGHEEIIPTAQPASNRCVLM